MFVTQLCFIHVVTFFHYQLMSSFLWAGLGTVSYNLDDVLLINPCDYVFVFEHFIIHHSDCLTCFGGTNRPDRYNTKTHMKNTNTSVNKY